MWPLIALLLTQTLTPSRVADRSCDIASRRSTRGGVACASVPPPIFEFAPASGAGMGAACACTTPTGTNGEVLTFSRGTTSWCSKNGETSGIVPGDLVECGVDIPRIMPGGVGTGGVGISIWEARTNTVLRNSELDNAVWVDVLQVTATAPTRTANYALAPDGTMTAERIQFPATALGEASGIKQLDACPDSTTDVFSIYIKGVSSNGTVEIMTDDGTNYHRITGGYVSGSWSRLSKRNINVTGATRPLYIGNFGTITDAQPLWGGVVKPANDVLLWMPQCEVGGTGGGVASPVISTAGTPATRDEDIAYVTFTAPAAATWSFASTVVIPAQLKDSVLIGGTIYQNANNQYQGYWDFGNLRYASYWDVGGGAVEAAGAGDNPHGVTLNASNRLSMSYSGGTVGNICVAGACSTLAVTEFTPMSGSIKFYPGANGAPTYTVNGTVKKVCFDTNPTGCL